MNREDYFDAAVKAAKESGIEEKEWSGIYEPLVDTNECCFKCWKSSSGACAWMRGGYNPVDGWIAKPSEHIKGSYKILFCPEFEKEGKARRDFDEDGAIRLMCAIAKYAADEYRDVLRGIMEYRKTMYTWNGSKKNGDFVWNYKDAISLRQVLEYMLGRHCKMIQKELGFHESEADEIIQAIDASMMARPKVRRWNVNG